MRWQDWLGVGERRWKKAPDEEVRPPKTLWDWLQLLIVPAILIGVTFAWSATQTKSDNKREDRRIDADRAAAEEVRQDVTLQTYLNQMSALMLDKKLLSSKPDDPARAVARTVSLATLRRLDGERRGAVVHFLSEARLLGIKDPRVDLDGADLGGATLAGAYLLGVSLGAVNLRRAHLEGAILADADLEGAHLEGANLGGRAHLERAILKNASLEDANLSGADLADADLGGAVLRGANFEGTYLVGAHLNEAALEGAEKLNLGRFITDLVFRKKQKEFLDWQKEFLDSLSREELGKFNLTPEKLAKLRREANGA
jgi:uncharacterized protein YjbI with pentapeptide repeats